MASSNPAIAVPGIQSISISGYKSYPKETSIEVRPLTILCGANSSGKSSIMQPLLLLKQTLESTYDAGSLLLNGPNIKFTSAAQFLSRIGKSHLASFSVRLDFDAGTYVRVTFKRSPNGIEIDHMDYREDSFERSIHPEMDPSKIVEVLGEPYKGFVDSITPSGQPSQFDWGIVRDRCFLVPYLVTRESRSPVSGFNLTPSSRLEKLIRDCIYLPGLRGNPERTYPFTAVGETFPGPFQEYSASVIQQWQNKKDLGRLGALREDLEKLGLTARVAAHRVADTQVELRVGRLTRRKVDVGGLVSIADVGLGVSQALPVLVALHVAGPGQLVFLEQPEIHLHPKAQSELAGALARASNRGVRVVVETHSPLLLLGIQTLVAKQILAPGVAILHWFTRHDDGTTEIETAEMREDGSFGAWPEDFARVSLALESEYLTAAETHLARSRQGKW